MASYYLWCPKADATQHRACMTDEEAAKVPWGRTLPSEQQIEAWLTRDLGEVYDTPDALLHNWYQDNFDPLNVTACHFDRIATGEEINEQTWPSHVKAYGRFGAWGAGREIYPEVRRLYRCSIHGVPPSKVYIRSYNWDMLWEPIRSQHFKHIYRELTPEQVRARFGRHYDALAARARIPYGARHLRFVAPIRTITTTHDLW